MQPYLGGTVSIVGLHYLSCGALWANVFTPDVDKLDMSSAYLGQHVKEVCRLGVCGVRLNRWIVVVALWLIITKAG